MPVRPVAEENAENRLWPARFRTRQTRLNIRGVPDSEPHVFSTPNAPPSDFVLVRGVRRGGEQHPDLDLTSGCEDEDMSDGPPADSADDSDSEACKREVIEPSSFLRIGTVFEGRQRVSQASAGADTVKEEQWDVSVSVQEVDLSRGRCSGSMRILQGERPITTYWRGEIIDDVNHSFVTCKWGASYIIDMSHWRKFKEFAPLRKRVTRLHGRCYKVHEMPVIFMRWKEMFFMGEANEESNLTIAGFYYICLCRTTGKIEGYYFDPSSMPFQKLELHPLSQRSYYASCTFV